MFLSEKHELSYSETRHNTPSSPTGYKISPFQASHMKYNLSCLLCVKYVSRFASQPEVHTSKAQFYKRQVWQHGTPDGEFLVLVMLHPV